jgi:hypothetical protein
MVGSVRLRVAFELHSTTRIIADLVDEEFVAA